MKLKRVGTEQSDLSPEDVVRELKRFWENGGNEHFQEEEEILLPAYAQYEEIDKPEIAENLLEHVKIRSLIDQVLRTTPPSIDELHKLGDMLEAHVRKEERVIFPMIEKALPEERLYELATHFHVNASR